MNFRFSNETRPQTRYESLAVTVVFAASIIVIVSAVANIVDTDAITYLGDSYDLALPAGSHTGFNPNEVSMQQLCAQSPYGERSRQHIGGFCSLGGSEALRRFAFSISPQSHVHPLLSNPRIMFGWSVRPEHSTPSMELVGRTLWKFERRKQPFRSRIHADQV